MSDPTNNDNSAPHIDVPVGDPNLIRVLQYYCDLAKTGKIIAVAIVAVTPAGDVFANPALPQNPSVMQLVMGALAAMSIDINDMVRKFRQSLQASPIIKPNGLQLRQ